MEVILRRPLLSVALLQMLAQRTVDFRERIESLSTTQTSCRLARSLIRFSDRLGAVDEDSAVRIARLTHELLAQYVGTSREIITQHMNQFRRQGYVRYSRKGIMLCTERLRQWLRQNA